MVDRTKETLDGAVATTKGWVNPKTGELLVSIRGLPDAIEWTKGPIEVAAPKVDLESDSLEAVAKAKAPAKKATKKTTKTAE